jgi:hypothetical protein
MELILSLKHNQTTVLKSIFEEVPVECAFVILTDNQFIDTAPFLVWRAQTSYTARHFIVKNTGQTVGEVKGSFVAFLTDHKDDEFLVFEDVRHLFSLRITEGISFRRLTIYRIGVLRKSNSIFVEIIPATFVRRLGFLLPSEIEPQK